MSRIATGVVLLMVGAFSAQTAESQFKAGTDFGGLGRRYVMWLSGPHPVFKELKITPEQAQKIAQLRDDLRDAARKSDPEEVSKDFRKVDVALENRFLKEVAEVLDEKQRERFLGLRIQLNNSLRVLTEDEEVISKLQLTKEQRSQLEKIHEGVPVSGNINTVQAVFEAARKGDERALAVLTKEQRADYEMMKGAILELKRPDAGAK